MITKTACGTTTVCMKWIDTFTVEVAVNKLESKLLGIERLHFHNSLDKLSHVYLLLSVLARLSTWARTFDAIILKINSEWD